MHNCLVAWATRSEKWTIKSLSYTIGGLSLLINVTCVPLYRVIRHLSLRRTVVSCMTFCVSFRYGIYFYLYDVRLASSPSRKSCLRLIVFVHFLFQWDEEITILPSTDDIVPWRARIDPDTSRTAHASFAHIQRSFLCVTLFSFGSLHLSFIPLYPSVVAFLPLSCLFAQTPLL